MPTEKFCNYLIMCIKMKCVCALSDDAFVSLFPEPISLICMYKQKNELLNLIFEKNGTEEERARSTHSHIPF